MCSFACSDSDDAKRVFDIDSYPQLWKLTAMSGGLSGAFYEEDELPWQETITLRRDETFTKVRLIDNEILEGNGVFIFEEKNGTMYLILKFDSETELIESCIGEKITQTFVMTSNNSLGGGSAPCDGPLFYERIE